MQPNPVTIGVDLGGTKIEAVAMSSDGREFGRFRIPTPKDNYEGTLNAVESLVHQTRETLDGVAVASIGIGIPGSPSPKTGLIRNANSIWLNGKPLHHDLQARFDVPLHLANDANCFALSEAFDGAGESYRSVFGIILGTGVGGGLVINQRLHPGRNAIAGEWGHNPLPWPDESEGSGPLCFCGRRGCIETFLSGPALETQYRKTAGSSLASRSIAERALNGDPISEQLLNAYTTRLAKALAIVINLVDPDVVVFGGGLSNIPAILTKTRTELPQWVFSDSCDTEFKINRWGDSGGVRGAARLGSLPTQHDIALAK